MTPPDPVPQLVADLLRLGVGLVLNGKAAFTLPAEEPARSRARRAVELGLPLLRDRRADVLRAWPRVAAGEPAGGGGEPDYCPLCRALVFAGVGRVSAADVAWCCDRGDCPCRPGVTR